MTVTFVSATRQTVWRWPAVLNFWLGGVAGGFWLSMLAVQWWTATIDAPEDRHSLMLLAPGLMLVGASALGLEAGRPTRALLVLANLRRSWMSREAFAVALFVPLATMAAVSAYGSLSVLAAAAALGVVASHGFILLRARAAAAWNVPLTPVLIAASALSSGAGLMVSVVVFAGWPLSETVLAIAALALILDASAWLAYLGYRGSEAFRAATAALRRPRSIAITAGVCRALPAAVLTTLVLGLNSGTPGRITTVAVACCGLIAVGAGLQLKRDLISSAGSLRPLRVAWPRASAAARLQP